MIRRRGAQLSHCWRSHHLHAWRHWRCENGACGWTHYPRGWRDGDAYRIKDE